MKLFFRNFGEGEPVIILHGLFGMSDNWVPFAKMLSEKKYSVYIPDIRNHGNSPHSDEFNYEVLVEDMLEFIHEHNLVNPVIIGHSMGGLIAMNFALKYPEAINKMIIIDIGIKNFPTHNLEILKAMQGIDFSEIKSRIEIEKILLEKLKQKKIIELILKNIKRNTENGFSWKLNLKVLNGNLNNIFKSIDSKERSLVPSLFIAAENSDYLSIKDMPEIENIFPHSYLLGISGCSHWIHAEKPDELLGLIFNFIV